MNVSIRNFILFFILFISLFWYFYRSKEYATKGLEKFYFSIKIAFIVAVAILGAPHTSSAGENPSNSADAFGVTSSKVTPSGKGLFGAQNQDSSPNDNPKKGGNSDGSDPNLPAPEKYSNYGAGGVDKPIGLYHTPFIPTETETDESDQCFEEEFDEKESNLEALTKSKLPSDVKQKLIDNPELLELSIDPRNGRINKQSFDEAESITQAERETGLITDPRRPNMEKEERDIDFIVSGDLYGEVDIKTPKSFFDSRKGPKKPIPQDVLDSLAKALGDKSIRQKAGSDKCLHILDLKDIQPHQKESYKAKFLEGAREADPVLAEHITVQND